MTYIDFNKKEFYKLSDAFPVLMGNIHDVLSEISRYFTRLSNINAINNHGDFLFENVDLAFTFLDDKSICFDSSEENLNFNELFNIFYNTHITSTGKYIPMFNFKTAPYTNPVYVKLFAAFGGTQRLCIRLKSISTKMYSTIERENEIEHFSYRTAKIIIEIDDNFGVDIEDVWKDNAEYFSVSRMAAKRVRDELMSLWMLQHYYNYIPYRNKLILDNISINFLI